MTKSTRENFAPEISEFFDAGENAGSIDTSLLIAELTKEYLRTGRSVEVDFRALVSWVRLGDQLTHQIHPYPAKLLPHIAHFFSRASVYTGNQRRILDPFCGSGTVALEASLAGHKPFVADANPLALLITRVKTTPYSPEDLRSSLDSLLRRVVRYRTAPKISVVNDHLWYSPEKKKALEILIRAVTEMDDLVHQDFFRVCLSVTARRLSLADPSISVPVRLRIKDSFDGNTNSAIRARLKWVKETDVNAEFRKVCEANIARVQEANIARSDRVAAIEVGTDARSLTNPNSDGTQVLENGSIPLLITSPPYGSAQKYIRATSISLNWLGLADPQGLSPLEGRSIGREHVPAFRQQELGQELPDKYEDLLRKVKKTNDLRSRITRQYLHEMRDALTEMARVVSPTGRIVLIVGNNQVCGEPLRNDEFVSEMLGDLGLNRELALLDHIKSRGLMTKRNKTASLISRESVLVFSSR